MDPAIASQQRSPSLPNASNMAATNNAATSICMMIDQRGSALLDEDVEQIDVLDKVPVADEFVPDPLPGMLSDRCGQRGTIEQQVQPVRETQQIVGIWQQQPFLTVGDLVLDATHRTGHYRTALPHRLGDGEPEPLDEALLHHHRRMALHPVDDDRVLTDVIPSERSPGGIVHVPRCASVPTCPGLVGH